MSNSSTHRRVLKLISSIRNSHKDMEFLFTEGQCYNFFLILKSVFKDAEAWHDGCHVYTRIDRVFYDIKRAHKKNNSWQKLDNKSGDRPHRWGLRDKRRLRSD